MKHQRYITAIALALLGLGYTTAQAQKADTLRRSLTVLTSEAVELGEQRPQTFVLPALPMRKAQAINTTPSPLGHRPDLLRPSALGTLAPLPELLPTATSLGYVDALLGLKYNASLSVGLRPLQRRGEQLDLLAYGRFTHHSISPTELGVDAREQAFGISGFYQRSSASRQFALGAEYEYGKHNYYGLLPLGSPYTTQTQLLPAEVDGLMGLNLKTNQVRLVLDTRSLTPGRDGWQYHLTPRLVYTQASGVVSLVSPDYRTGELAPSIALGLTRSLGEVMQAGVDVEGRMLFYSNDDALGRSVLTMTTGFDNRTFIRLAPYWAMASEAGSLRYQLRLGLAIDSYRKGDRSRWQIAPNLEGTLSWQDWSLQAKVYGDVVTNSLAEMLGEMPYLQVGLQAAPTARPLVASLQLRGSVSPSLALELEAGYQKLRDALNYIPLPHDAELGTTTYPLARTLGVSFVPETIASASIATLGGALTYRHDGLWGLTLRGQYQHLSEGLLARPSLTLGVSWQWLASSRWNASLGYDLTSGIKYVSLASLSRTEETLRPMQVLSARGAYRISQRLSIKGDAQYQIASEGRLYPYYQPQQFVFNLGATYTF